MLLRMRCVPWETPSSSAHLFFQDCRATPGFSETLPKEYGGAKVHHYWLGGGVVAQRGEA
jgi:hypothetical protein